MSQAQDASTKTAATSTDQTKETKQAPQNGYGEFLKPKVKRAKSNEIYNPIKKPVDDGQMPEIEMYVGESRVFPAPGVARIAVGNGEIMAAAALDDKEIIIFANKVGTSSLFVWNEDGRYQRVKINIVPGDTTRIAREIASFLTAIPHAKATVVGDKVIVEGDTLSDEDRDKVAEIAKRYPQIVNFTSPIGWEQMVMMDVKVVEFPKTELKEFGLKWSAMGGASIGAVWAPITHGNNVGLYSVNIPQGSTGLPLVNPDGSSKGIPLFSAPNALGALNLGIGAQLNMLEQNGKASILAEPQLSARSGYHASFLAGGEFPYSVSTVNGVTILFKPYGIKLDIEPKVGRNGVIRSVIDTEVSSIDTSITSAAGPALLTRKTKTEFNVKTGETIVLSGLLQRTSSTDIDQVPWLGDIPVLGALFRSKRFQNKETELVIFVTPTIVDSRSPGLVDRVAKTTQRLSENLGKSPYLSDPLQPLSDASKFNRMPGTEPVTPEKKPTAVAGQDSPELGGSSLRVTVDGLVLRSEPKASSTALLQLGRNAVVLLGRSDPRRSGKDLWRNVVVGEYDGWVLANAVEPAPMQSVRASNSKSKIVQKDQTGDVIHLGVSEAPSNQQDRFVTANVSAKQYRVQLNNLALRVTPDINAQSVKKLLEGQTVDALPIPPLGNWTAVQVDGVSGWVATQWLKPSRPAQ